MFYAIVLENQMGSPSSKKRSKREVRKKHSRNKERGREIAICFGDVVNSHFVLWIPSFSHSILDVS